MADKLRVELLVIGGSAGSLSMVLKIIPLLKMEMNLAVIIIFHRKTSDDTTLLDILSTKTEFLVKEADEKDELAAGTIYLAPADYHVLIENDHTLSLDVSEKVNYSRPSIDVTFESAAETYQQKVACLLLSGANADGVEGLVKARAFGSVIMVQDPQSAEVPFMPQEAIKRLPVDFLLRDTNLSEMLEFLRHKF